MVITALAISVVISFIAGFLARGWLENKKAGAIRELQKVTRQAKSIEAHLHDEHYTIEDL